MEQQTLGASEKTSPQSFFIFILETSLCALQLLKRPVNDPYMQLALRVSLSLAHTIVSTDLSGLVA